VPIGEESESGLGHSADQNELEEDNDDNEESDGEMDRPRPGSERRLSGLRLGAPRPPDPRCPSVSSPSGRLVRNGRRTMKLTIEEVKASGFDLDDEEGIRQWVESKRLRLGTHGAYDTYWESWEDFWEYARSLGRHGDTRLTGVTSQDRVGYWEGYIVYLRVTLCVSPDRVSQFVSAVKGQLDRKGVDTSFTEHIRCKDALEAVKKRSKEEVRELLRKRADKFIIPMFGELMTWIFEEAWVKTSWHGPKNLKIKAAALAAHMSEGPGYRPCQLIRARKGRDDHALQAQDIAIVAREADGSLASHRGGSEGAKGRSVAAGTCVEWRTDILSSKPFNFQGARQTTIAGVDEMGDRTMEMLCEWLTHSGVQPEDPLLSWRYRSENNGRLYRNTLTASGFNNLLKLAAVGVNVPPEHVSAKSFRGGTATNGALTGKSDEEIREQGMWKSKTVPKKHYDKSRQIHRAPGDLRPATREDVLSLLPPEKRPKLGGATSSSAGSSSSGWGGGAAADEGACGDSGTVEAPKRGSRGRTSKESKSG
jgi:hypothetical protein